MKARAEAQGSRRGRAGGEIKRSPGGIRDVEFSVQLLQLVHGHHDPTIRNRSTLGALEELTAAGYVSREDGAVLADSYRFLRTVEHRLQLVEEEQTHALPTDPAARRRLARVLGFTDGPTLTATAAFDETMRRCQSDVRLIHERLYFRPLLEAFAALEAQAVEPADLPSAPVGMSADAVARRLTAFGFGDIRRTRAVVDELAGGLTRVSRLMGQLLPLLLDWLSVSPDPDLGLLALRTLVRRQSSPLPGRHRLPRSRPRRLGACVWSWARAGPWAEAIERNPELITDLDDDDALAPASRATLVDDAVERLRRPGDEDGRRTRLVRLTQDQTLRIATRDLLDIDDISTTGASLTTVAEAVLEAALDHVATDVPFCVVGMGRLGGAEMSYASDLDLLFVVGDTGADRRRGSGRSPVCASSMVRARPTGGHHRPRASSRGRPGTPGSRSSPGYEMYFERWAQTWERQALLRARVVAGDRLPRAPLSQPGSTLSSGDGSRAEDVADIRRIKARIERERIPPCEDPQFHLKLGRGSLSDIEWTAQLPQLRHGVSATGTMTALDALSEPGLVGHSRRRRPAPRLPVSRAHP